jgi:hypothetical protein
MEINEAVVHGPGLMGGITGLAKNLFGLAVSRVELAALELTEVRNHVIELLAIFAGRSCCHLVRAGLRHRHHRRAGLGRDGLEDPAGHVRRVRWSSRPSW